MDAGEIGMMDDGEKRKRKNAGIEAKRMDDVGRLGWRSWWGAKRMDDVGKRSGKAKRRTSESGKTRGLKRKRKSEAKSEAVNRGHRRRASVSVRQV